MPISTGDHLAHFSMPIIDRHRLYGIPMPITKSVQSPIIQVAW